MANKTFELSRKEIQSLYELTKEHPGCKVKLTYTTDGTLGCGYFIYAKFVNDDGTPNKELNNTLPSKKGVDISDDTQF